jgi:NitT/TauT family transport system substrate-binding protein
VELIDGNADYAQSMDAVAEGKIDAISFTLYDALRRIVQGKDIRMVALTDRSRGAEGLIVESDILSVQGLKGRKVGLLEGSYLEYFLERILQKNGLTLEDIQAVNIIPENSLAEYDEKKPAGMMTWEPQLTEMVNQRGMKKIADSSEYPGVNTGVLAFNGAYLDKNKEAVQGFVRAWFRAVDYLEDNPEQSMIIVARYSNLSESEAREFMLQDEVMDMKDSLSAMSYSSGFESLHGNSDQILKFLTRHKPIEEVSSLEFIDASFMRALPNDLDENIL